MVDTHLVVPKPKPPTAAEYIVNLVFLKDLTTAPIHACNRCKWPRVEECACIYCGSTWS